MLQPVIMRIIIVGLSLALDIIRLQNLCCMLFAVRCSLIFASLISVSTLEMIAEKLGWKVFDVGRGAGVLSSNLVISFLVSSSFSVVLSVAFSLSDLRINPCLVLIITSFDVG